MSENINSHPVTKDFLKLTEYTCPHGWEGELYGDLLESYGANADIKGNYFLTIPGGNTLFTAHMDTAGREVQPKRIKRQWHKGGILATDKSTILGADDKAGMAVLLHMIRAEVPGVYAFYVGEESGCIGSHYHADNWKEYLPHLSLPTIQQVVSFDRYGYESVITEQWTRCASDTYAQAVADQYKEQGVEWLKPDNTGLFTDSASFSHIVPECTNISVGYYNHHTTSEQQHVPFLIMIAEASAKLRWNELPIERDPIEDSYRAQYSMYGRHEKDFTYVLGDDGKWTKRYGNSGYDDDVDYYKRNAAVNYRGIATSAEIFEYGDAMAWHELWDYAKTRSPEEVADLLEQLLADRADKYDEIRDLKLQLEGQGRLGFEDDDDDPFGNQFYAG